MCDLRTQQPTDNVSYTFAVIWDSVYYSKLVQ
jgi:hypothetical protein